MKKSVIFIVLLLSGIMFSQASAQFSFDTSTSYDSEEEVTFIVEMEDSPVLPEIKLSQETKSSAKARDAQTYRSALLRAQKRATDAISSEISDDVKPQYTYTELFNGFAIKAKYKDLETIKNTDGVKNVYVSSKRKADLRMSSATSVTHSLPSETLGYTGSGQVIAIIDTEFDVKHDAFSKAPKNPKYTKQGIASILSVTEFNASNDANRVYESAKIPFRFDYSENDADTYSTANMHGTHVAGIAAGNSSDGGFLGVAPDAQLVLMKISNSDGYLEDAAIAAALDDAAKLGVCAINCSFGYDYQALDNHNPVLITCYENAYKAGIFVSAAAGNQGRGFLEKALETTNIDDSATGTPNGFDTTISVASVDNSVIYLMITDITLSDGSVIEATPMYNFTASLTAGEYEYCNLGYPEDFEGLDLNGKIAVVDRGVLPFKDKSDNAKAAGATGIIIINNDDEYIATDTLSLPAVCVKSSSGAVLKDAEVKRITSVTPFDARGVEHDVITSSFSSYGTTEALGLKPEISAPGGSISSAWPGDQYAVASGTSMAAPHITGVVAIINQYLEDTGCTLTSSARVDRIANMMMSSADVVYMPSDDEENKVPYSPRVQGAGVVNTANAIKTPVILYANNGKTKIEFGDNLTDTLEIKFTAQNLTDSDVVYDKISAVTLTDGYVTENGINYISGAKLLKSELVTDFDAVTVPANSSVTVSAQIKLDSDELYENYLVFSNGFHIDGFIRLENTASDIVAVGMPFMGFYGNWTQAPVFDSTMYDEGGSKLVNEDKGILGTFLFTNAKDKAVILGQNKISGIYDSDAIVISPNGDGYADILGIYFSAMRSIRDLRIMLIDERGKILSVQGADVIIKYRPCEKQIKIPQNISDGSYFVRLEGYMNYDTENSLKHSVSIPLKVDRERSYVTGCKLDGKVLTVDIYDNAGIKSVLITDLVTGEKYTKNYDSYTAEDKIIYTFEENTAPDLSNIKVEIIDGAMNASAYELGGFGGKIGAEIYEISSDEKSYSITFNFMGDDEFSDASLILAFYDDEGRLIHSDIKHNQSVSSGECNFTGDFDVSTADKCKLFIWRDTETIKPLDTTKIFDISRYKKGA